MRSLGTPWAKPPVCLLLGGSPSPLPGQPGTTGDLGEGPRSPLASTRKQRTTSDAGWHQSSEANSPMLRGRGFGYDYHISPHCHSRSRVVGHLSTIMNATIWGEEMLSCRRHSTKTQAELSERLSIERIKFRRNRGSILSPRPYSSLVGFIGLISCRARWERESRERLVDTCRIK